MQTFTLEEAAAVIANQYGWHEGAQKTLLKQLLDAAKDGTLIVRHPHTDLPYHPKEHCEYYETVGVSDLNRFFQAAGAPWRLGNDDETADRTAGSAAPAELLAMADEWSPKIGWDHWKELDLWQLAAACKLICGDNPNEPPQPGDIENPDPSTRLVWVNLFHTATAAIMAGKLNLKNGCVYPAEFIVWARGKGAQIHAQLLAMAGQKTAIKGDRGHNKRETEARNVAWQQAIDELATNHPGTSHIELCRKLAKEVGATPQNVRRRTKRPQN
jgi:hypothetical protein